MLNKTQYEALLERAGQYAFTSLQYPDYDELCACDVFADGEAGLALCDPSRAPARIHWAANGAEALKTLLTKAPHTAIIPFVPQAFVPVLAGAGFEVFAEFADHFNMDLARTAAGLAPHEPRFLRGEEAEEAAALSAAVRGQSRGFLGETPAFFLEWMQEGDVLAEHEHGELAGFCCVSIYNGGSTLWVREIAVRPQSQGKGVGRRLLEGAVLYGAARGAAKGFLAVDVHNDRAIGLYESLGFARRGAESEIQMARGMGAV